MFEQIILSGNVLLRNMIQKDPMPIVRPIASFFGFILNVIYDGIAALSSDGANTLGFAIILMTLVAKLIMLPLSVKSQKSMIAMQKLQPEMDKIKKKYGDTKDPELQRKMSVEMNQLYSKNGANPIMGCLPIFIQLPIFMALYYIMNQSYMFISKLGQIYTEIASLIMSDSYVEVMKTLATPKLPNGMSIDIAIESDVVRVLGKFNASDWEYLLNNLSQQTAASLTPLLEVKNNIENFFSIALTENTGFSWPSILIPIACVVFTFLTSYMTSKQSKSSDPNMKMQQNMMMFMMPVMMGFMTLGMPAGMGLYWAASNALQIVQQYALNKIYNKPSSSDVIVDPKPVNKGK